MPTQPSHNLQGCLFRIEAVEAQGQKQYGQVLLARPVSFRLLTIGTITVLTMITLFIFTFGFTRKETVIGVLVPQEGLVRVLAPQNGLLIRSNVRDGQKVEKDEPLFVFSSEIVSNQGETQMNVSLWMRSRIESLKREVKQLSSQQSAQETSNHRRAADLITQISKIEQEITLQRKRVDMANISVKRQLRDYL